MIATTRPAVLEFPDSWKSRYQYIQTLGKGGYAIVCQAQDEALSIPVVLKLLRQEPPQKKTPVELHLRAARAHFQQEAEILRLLQERSIPGIPYLYESQENALAMTFIGGVSLYDYAFAPKSSREVLEIAQKICARLLPLHRLSDPVVFCDLTPDNILLTPDKSVFLIDFGLARSMSKGAPIELRHHGSAHYAAPELYSGLNQDPVVSPKTDAYSLGAILYLLLTGQVLSAKNILPAELRVSLLKTNIPRTLVELIIQMLHRFPRHRPTLMEIESELVAITRQ